MFNCVDICFILCYVCCLCVVVVVIDYLLNICFVLCLCLFSGLEVGQFNLYIVVEFFGDIQCFFGGVDIGVVDYCDLVGVGFEVYL